DGQVYVDEKINAAYTIGSKYGADEASVLAAQTIKREVFPQLALNGIVDVNFAGFIRVVDTLGCAYVDVDHRYFNENVGTTETDYTNINLQPGYQKLCYEDALDYVRYRHTDSDFVRVARQQDFLRDLREQISPEDELGQIETVAKAVGHAIRSNFHASAGELILLAKLVAFSQAKPLRQVKFLTSDVDYAYRGGSYVLSTPQLEHETLENFLGDGERVTLPAAPVAGGAAGRSPHAIGGPPQVIGLYPTSAAGRSEASRAAGGVPFAMLYPGLQTGAAEQQTVRPYALTDQRGHLRHAYVVVFKQSAAGGYYDLEGTDWPDPPLFARAHSEAVDGRRLLLVDDGPHIHVVGWRSRGVLYWLTNTLLEELSNQQMLAIAGSARALR
ncbi:MAG TPA: LCP family protein, partial [Solirubrobacteraceae bacterium]|nr:LCP family protein [Solirubrobacteraceae bacterium]